MRYYPIDEALAKEAKRMISFDDYKEGTATLEYQKMVDAAYDIAESQKGKTDAIYHEKIDYWVDRYAKLLADNLNSRYRIMSRCPSVMISGPANFPTKQKERQNTAYDKNMKEYEHISKILNKLSSIGTNGISSDNPRALELLENKLFELRKLREDMKQINVYYRKHKTLDGCPGFNEELEKIAVNELKTNPGAVPFQSYQFANIYARIKQTKNRIRNLKALEEVETGWKFDGGEVVINREIGRLQILFDDLPSEEIRAELKRKGFRWSSMNKVWQRKLTQNAIYAAKHLETIHYDTSSDTKIPYKE